MKKKKRGTFLLIGLVSSVFLLMSPTKTCADSTSTTAFSVTFSAQEAAGDNDHLSDLPVIKTVMSKKSYAVSYGVQTKQKRLPMTGEEYNVVLYRLGWITLLGVFLFFFIGSYARKGEKDRG